MDVAKVAKDYYLSSQSTLLIANQEYGSRKMINVGGARFVPSAGNSSSSTVNNNNNNSSSSNIDDSINADNNNSSSSNIQHKSSMENNSTKMRKTSTTYSNSNLKGIQVRSASYSSDDLDRNSYNDDLDDPGVTPPRVQYQDKASRKTSVKDMLSSGKDMIASGVNNMRSSVAARRRGSLPPKAGNKTWLHPPEALLKGHILYTVKFLGDCTVEQAKGTDVVKDAIRKMKFNKHIKRAEGVKPPKVELTVSSDAVKVLDPKTKVTLHQFPLHRISYCADDKSDKRMFTFIAKAAQGNEHYCFVFDSEKCAEEITLTIGQAFDLAYKKFLETSESDSPSIQTPQSDSDLRKQCVLMQKMVQKLRFENEELKTRLRAMERLKDRSDVDEYKKNNQIHDLTTMTLSLRESSTDEDDEVIYANVNKQKPSTVGRRLENLILPSDSSEAHPQATNGSNGRLQSAGATPMLSPPPPSTRVSRHTPVKGNNNANSIASPSQSSNPFLASPAQPSSSQFNPFSPEASGGDPFGSDPFNAEGSVKVDPFGMDAFSPPSKGGSESIMDMQAGFTRGLSFGADDFSLGDLDPLGHPGPQSPF